MIKKLGANSKTRENVNGLKKSKKKQEGNAK